MLGFMSCPLSSYIIASVSAMPRLCTAPPCIWPSTASGLMALPTSCTTTNSCSVSSPVSRSTSMRAMCAAHDHAAVHDLEVLHRGFELAGGDLERLAPRVLRCLHDRNADGVDRLAARAEAGHRRHVGVARRDLHLLDVDAVRRRGDLRQRDVR